MKTIPLTKGREAIVDDENYDRLVAMGRWYALVGPRTVYAAKRAPRRRPAGEPSVILMHRVILGCNGRGDEGDHHDGNGLNNQKVNLRRCTSGQNKANSRAKGSRSKYKGVQPNGPGWCALICVNYKRRYLGQFSREIDAAMAYDAAARATFGEFAKTNFEEEL